VMSSIVAGSGGVALSHVMRRFVAGGGSVAIMSCVDALCGWRWRCCDEIM
jgi:hypothetical protein